MLVVASTNGQNGELKAARTSGWRASSSSRRLVPLHYGEGVDVAERYGLAALRASLAVGTAAVAGEVGTEQP